MNQITKESFEDFVKKEFPEKEYKWEYKDGHGYMYIQAGTGKRFSGAEVHYEFYDGQVRVHIEGPHWWSLRNDLYSRLARHKELRGEVWQKRQNCQWILTSDEDDIFSKFKQMRDIVEEEILIYEEERKTDEESENEPVILKSLTLSGLLKRNLKIPEYQRNYEWKTEHVKALLEDTYNAFQEDKSYLMGTVILHKKDGEYNIVDGQQRLITFSILLYVLNSTQYSLMETKYQSETSKWYLRNTYKLVKEFVEKIGVEKTAYSEYLQNILFSVVVLSVDGALELAYTFFDSLNSKGKSLSDYDLLKAHHLMFIPEKEESLAKLHNDKWQSRDDKHRKLFETLLMRLRRWADGHERDNTEKYAVFNEFTSAMDFKTTENTEHVFNRYMQPNVFRSWHRENNQIVLNQKIADHILEDLLPMEIQQTIEGGDAFFLYAERYHKIYDMLFGVNAKDDLSTSIRYVADLSGHIDNAQIQWAFEAIMLLYFDKFGEQKLIEAASCVELILAKVRFTTKDNQRGVRALSSASIVKYVAKEKIVPIISKSTIAAHVCVQLFQNLYHQSFVPEEGVSGVRLNYLSRITSFYKKHQHLIPNDGLNQKIEQLYKIKKETNYDK